MKIQAVGATTKIGGDVVLVLEDDEMPSDCVVIFIKKEDSPRLLELIKEIEK